MCGNCRSFKVSASPFGGYPVGCCDVQEGYYCIWTLNHATMECEEWAELCDLRSILHTISHITFNVVAERARARTALMNLRREAPFGECKRFPWRKTYVNVSCSVYSSLLQDILSSLDFKDRETEKELRYGSGHKQDDKDQTASGNSSLDDSKTRFRNTLVKFQNALCKKDEVYDRIKFEQKYNLRWCLGPCPSEPEGSPGNPDNPNLPKRPTYGDMMKAMRSKGLSPSDFDVFKLEDIAKGDFVCDRETQSLGPDMSELKLPKEATRVFIFARAEYSECGDEGSEVQGYIYDIKRGVVNGPVDLKKYSGFGLGRRKRNILKEFEEVRLTKSQWEAISRIVQSSSGSEDENDEGSVIEAII